MSSAWYESVTCLAAYLFTGESAGDAGVNFAAPGTSNLADSGTVARSNGGAFGLAAEFDKTAGQALIVPQIDAGLVALLGSRWTVTAYVKHDGAITASTSPRILGKEDVSPASRSYRMYIDDSDVLHFQASANGSTYAVDLEASITPTDGNYIAVTSDGTTVTLYVNGVAQDTATAVTTLFNTDDFAIGNTPTDNVAFRFNGWIDEVAFFSKALTAFEVQAIMSLGLAGGTPPLSSVVIDNRNLLAAEVWTGALDAQTEVSAAIEPDLSCVNLLNPVITIVDIVEGEIDVSN